MTRWINRLPDLSSRLRGSMSTVARVTGKLNEAATQLTPTTRHLHEGGTQMADSSRHSSSAVTVVGFNVEAGEART